jgi:hypothetical protein
MTLSAMTKTSEQQVSLLALAACPALAEGIVDTGHNNGEEKT